MKLRVLLLLGLLAGSLTSQALASQPDPTGTWIGQWDRGGSLLDVEVVFSRTDSGYLEASPPAPRHPEGVSA